MKMWADVKKITVVKDIGLPGNIPVRKHRMIILLGRGDEVMGRISIWKQSKKGDKRQCEL